MTVAAKKTKNAALGIERYGGRMRELWDKLEFQLYGSRVSQACWLDVPCSTHSSKGGVVQGCNCRQLRLKERGKPTGFRVIIIGASLMSPKPDYSALALVAPYNN